MAGSAKNPRVLIVTPEVTYLPKEMGHIAVGLSAKAGGLADVSAALISALFDQGADVHVALPNYRTLFNAQLAPILTKELSIIRKKMPDDRIHLAEDRAFFYMQGVYSNYGEENIKIALAFQREVINNILPFVRPDLIHCNDWMTGLIPAVARKMGIPCLFTIHNIHTVKETLARIEDMGIDAAYFWEHLYYDNMAYDYERTRNENPVDFLTSGVFASHFVNTVSPTFLVEVAQRHHSFIKPSLQQELANKLYAECAAGILNAPDSSYDPSTDPSVFQQYTAENVMPAKRANKRLLQRTMGLIEDPRAPVFFWPSRLDSVQKGCQLLAEILYAVVARYRKEKLQVVFVADGEFKKHFENIVRIHGIEDRVADWGFDERMARLAYAGSDFILMPSRFEPCGLPQMIGPLYGALSVAHDTGGLHDTVEHLDADRGTGNGFVFKHYDSQGLSWAMDQAMAFHKLPQAAKRAQIQRIMTQSAVRFTHEVCARQYIDLYEKMLQRPLIVGQGQGA
jgi:starch synthase